jgi:type IV pilus assembly protein PilB
VTTSVRPAAQLDDLLLARGLVTREQLAQAREQAAQRGRSLGRVLIELGAVSEGGLVAVLADQLGLEFVDLSETQLDQSALALVPESVARRHNCIPVRFEEDRLVVAMADPGNVLAVDDIRALTKRDIKTVVATKADVIAALSRLYRLDRAAETLVEEAAAEQDTEEDLDAAVARAGEEDAPIIRLVNMLITQAIQDRASDIHIEPEERHVRVRYRIDGVLHEVMKIGRASCRERV